MKNLKVFIAILLVLFMVGASAYADCRGCCSGHGGTVCLDGVTICADGTEMSEKCKAKCDKCVAMSKPAPISNGESSKKIAVKGNTSIQSFNKAKKTLLRDEVVKKKKTPC